MRFARVHSVCRSKQEDPIRSRQFGEVGESDHKGQLEICFHIKEAWNIFEVMRFYNYYLCSDVYLCCLVMGCY